MNKRIDKQGLYFKARNYLRLVYKQKIESNAKEYQKRENELVNHMMSRPASKWTDIYAVKALNETIHKRK